MTNGADVDGLALATARATLDSLLAVTGADWATATVLDNVDGQPVEEVVAASGTPPHRTPEAADEILDFPIPSLDGLSVAGHVRLGGTEARLRDSEITENLRLLATAASGIVLRESAERDRRRRAARVDPALMETLQAVRRAEDQVGNSLAVVLGWLRIWSQGPVDAPQGGTQIAIRRLEEVQAIIADLLRDTARSAIEEHARDIVDVNSALRDAGLVELAAGDDALVLGNRGHMTDFFTTAGPLLATEAALTPDTWLVPFARADQLGSASMLSLHASGGTMVMHQRGPAAAWTRSAQKVTP